MMTEGGFYQQKRLSPTGITVVVLLHAGALAALLTTKMVIDAAPKYQHTTVNSIKLPPPPPPKPQPKQPDQPQHQSHVDITKPLVRVPLPDPPVFEPVKSDPPVIAYTPPGRIDIPPPPPPPPPVVHEPVRLSAVIDSRSALQPPYPPSAQREGAEGFVQVRVSIGADGRVKAVEKVKASRDDFFAATERQALRYWHFKPATVDGTPVESSKVMSVTFKLDELNG